MISFASAAAFIVTTKGAICSMPEIEEIEKLRKKYEIYIIVCNGKWSEL
ncbi:MAG: hypothetical protein V8S33_01180 [Intestinibacter bartlettii]